MKRFSFLGDANKKCSSFSLCFVMIREVRTTVKGEIMNDYEHCKYD